MIGVYGPCEITLYRIALAADKIYVQSSVVFNRHFHRREIVAQLSVDNNFVAFNGVRTGNAVVVADVIGIQSYLIVAEHERIAVVVEILTEYFDIVLLGESVTYDCGHSVFYGETYSLGSAIEISRDFAVVVEEIKKKVSSVVFISSVDDAGRNPLKSSIIVKSEYARIRLSVIFRFAFERAGNFGGIAVLSVEAHILNHGNVITISRAGLPAPIEEKKSVDRVAVVKQTDNRKSRFGVRLLYFFNKRIVCVKRKFIRTRLFVVIRRRNFSVREIPFVRVESEIVYEPVFIDFRFIDFRTGRIEIVVRCGSDDARMESVFRGNAGCVSHIVIVGVTITEYAAGVRFVKTRRSLNARYVARGIRIENDHIVSCGADDSARVRNVFRGRSDACVIHAVDNTYV